jgi:hypothetical protein
LDPVQHRFCEREEHDERQEQWQEPEHGGRVAVDARILDDGRHHRQDAGQPDGGEDDERQQFCGDAVFSV